MRPQPTDRPQPAGPRPRRRGGFTLLELLIVVAVIAVLIALLVPALRGVVGQANDAAVRSELSGLEAGIASFHSAYGRNPPSYVNLTLNDAETAFADPRTFATMRNIFGTLIDQQLMIGSLANTGFYANQGAGDDGSRVLKGAECLVFFLGGMPAGPAVNDDGAIDVTRPSRELAGFSDNPRDPFSVLGSGGGSYAVADKNRRTGPFYDFDPSRLIYPDEIGDGVWFMYVDRYAGQRTPILYAESNEGRAYAPRDVRYGAGRAGSAFLNADGTPSLAYGPYRFTAAINTDADPDVPSGAFVNPKGYQLISPGEDGQFGGGGLYQDEEYKTFRLVGGVGSYAEPLGDDPGNDNITNFARGTLGGE